MNRMSGRLVSRFVLVLCAAYLLTAGVRIYFRKLYIWLPDYIRWAWSRPHSLPKPIHVFFLIGDHFEPGVNLSLTERWQNEYPALADRHHDSGGRRLQHTWFYPVEQKIDENMQALRGFAAQGYGETELHLHHFNDTYESGLVRYKSGIAYLQKYGFAKTVDGGTHFAFIHGNSGLDNSLGPRLCGINTELRLLRDLGCFADFTFPNIGDESQPSLVNQIYEATDDERPKSYDRGARLSVNRHASGDLLMFTGPVLIQPSFNARQLFWSIETSDLHPNYPASRNRVDLWMQAAIHIEGRPDWIFIKISFHGAQSPEALEASIGPEFDRALSYLESRYNDGRNYVLHYVTAREAYNLARAAEANRQGDPKLYLNWVIKPYMASRKVL